MESSNDQLKDNAVAREEFCTALRGLAWYGLQDGVFNHCSTLAYSKTGDRKVVLFPPFGYLWQDVTPESLVGVDPVSGEKMEGDHDIIELGKWVHLTIYRKRPDVKAVMHVHPPYATALSSMKENRLKMINQVSCQFYDVIAYDDYRLFKAGSQEEPEHTAQCLGDTKRAVMLLNHGVITVGPSVAVAFDLMFAMEKACKVQVRAMSSGELLELSDEVALGVRTSFDKSILEDSQKHLDALKHHFNKAKQ